MNSNGSATIKTITPKQLAAKLQSREDIQLIDVREESERAIASIGGELIPMGTVLENLSRIRRDGAVVVYCRSGGRSGRVVEALQQDYGYTNLLNLEGGVLRWSDEVDPAVKKY